MIGWTEVLPNELRISEEKGQAKIPNLVLDKLNLKYLG